MSNLSQPFSARARCACVHFDHCSCGYCPIDDAGRHLRDEAVCLWLREAVKANGRQNLEGSLPAPLVTRVLIIAERRLGGSDHLARALKRIAGRGSKLAAGRALARRHLSAAAEC
jgi:hypothetical protein